MRTVRRKSKIEQERVKRAAGSSRPSLRRTLVFLVTAIVSALFVLIYIGLNNLMVDQIIYLSAIGLIIYLLMVYSIMYDRKHGDVIYESTSYFRLFFVVVLQWVINALYPFMPDYVPVFMLLPFVLLPGLGMVPALGFCAFDIILYGMMYQPTFSLISYQLIQLFFGMLFSYLIREKIKNDEKDIRLYALLSLSCVFSTFYYFYSHLHRIEAKDLLKILLTALIITFIAVYIYPVCLEFFKRERNALYRAILSPSAMFKQEIKNFSESEYAHASKVSEFSARAAGVIGCDIKLARAGGFYYRLGKIYDRDNSAAVKIMEDNCFPREVIDIVYEYNGIIRRPTTRESAIVHMVDSVVTRLELMNDESVGSSWNQDMVIYQVLNELSGKGIYDNSGLSMNQYLKVRDYLVNTELISEQEA